MVKQTRVTTLKAVEPDWPSKMPCKIAFVGEAPGVEEAREGRPFVGSSGYMLDQIMKQVGIKREDCLITNVFNLRPPNNEVKHFFGSAPGPTPPRLGLPKYTHGHLKEEHAWQIERLRDEIRRADPNIIVAVGATPLWALSGTSGITKSRGMVHFSNFQDEGGRPYKVLPTFHPSYIMRGNWHLRQTLGLDVLKAVSLSKSKDLEIPARKVLIEPTLQDVSEFVNRCKEAEQRQAEGERLLLSYDIETEYKTLQQIRCIGFSLDARDSIAIPFTDWRNPSGSYWANLEDELEVWLMVQEMLSLPGLLKLAQNGMYDIMWLNRFGIDVRGTIRDTMVLHHALEPELPKDLGTLASLYSKETTAWKKFVSFTSGGKKDA